MEATGATTEADEPRMTPGFTAFVTAFAGAGVMILGLLLWAVLGLFGLLVSGVGAVMILVSPAVWVALRFKAR